MKRRVLSLAMAAALAVSLSVCALAAGGSSNKDRENYNTWDAKPVTSYLLPTEDGGLTRVEATDSKVVLVEEYDRNLLLKNTLELKMDLPIWGGFFAGEEFNFLVTGQSNPGERDSVEVMRVAKYSKDWKRLGQTSLRDVNTSEPFSFGSLRMAEGNGMLYIRTCHQMYADSAGNKSQSNMTVAIRESDMVCTDSAHMVEDVGSGYMSDSFNQFILVDSKNRIVALDQCDNFPIRGAVISIFPAAAGTQSVTGGSATKIVVQAFPSAILGDIRVTGASVGGFGEAESVYVAAYNYDGVGASEKSSEKSVYLAAVNKLTGVVTRNRLSAVPGSTTPHLVTDGTGGGYVLWNDVDSGRRITDNLHIVPFDSKGLPGTERNAKAPLSDCAPICVDGRVLWYVTEGGAPTFYEFSEKSGVRALRTGTAFEDAAEGSLLYGEVMWSAMTGCVVPDSDTQFGGEREATRAEVVYALWRAFGSPAPESRKTSFTDISRNDTYYDAVLWASENGVTTGTTETTFSPDKSVTRAETVTFLYRAAGAQPPKGLSNPFKDVPRNGYYTDAVLWAVDRGITRGTDTSGTIFDPNRTVTRRELAAFLYRWSAL